MFFYNFENSSVITTEPQQTLNCIKKTVCIETRLQCVWIDNNTHCLDFSLILDEKTEFITIQSSLLIQGFLMMNERMAMRRLIVLVAVFCCESGLSNAQDFPHSSTVSTHCLLTLTQVIDCCSHWNNFFLHVETVIYYQVLLNTYSRRSNV